jgi:modification methylase
VLQASSDPGDIVLDPFFGSGTTGAVAKQLGRHWIGIEQDKKYIRVAQKRIDNVPPLLGDGKVYETRARNQGFKIPFGKLLTLGLLKPGEKLYFNKTGDVATVLADGHLLFGEYRGSIHAVGSSLLGVRCNGWTQWEYIDGKTGKRESINNLRKKAELLIKPKDEI